ncbi:MAG: hypothetical protein KO206_08480 [Methanomicrobiaceae archaeon]|uniref:Type II toxin-antitoxin system ParD family antitoxin n=1 Tax=hydrocarbon metagenome TaxID=938273 RepID=A0A0W8FFI7_9ZZZZ|nr:hypothetical protein [Methanomicrobiaceae archaeon]MDD5420404.1 hypothetical protein [Methanomicrobiaceae archaeon]
MDGSRNQNSKQVGVRLPGHLYRWLREKVERGEYANMAQSVVGELTRARALEERREEERRRTAVTYEIDDELQDDPLIMLINERVEEIRRDLREEVRRWRNR